MADTKTNTKKPAAVAKGVSTSGSASAPSSGKVPAGELAGTKTGVVETDGRAKTRKVVVSYMSRHPKYGKYVRQRTVLQVHDEKNESKVGDIVEVTQCRPVSKSKNWRLVRIVEKRSELAAALASAREMQ